jgi:predicted RNase H-like HicB family nuclease
MLTKGKANHPIIKGSVPVIFLREGDTFIAFCPVLDLSTCGGTYEEADANFKEALDIFFVECAEKGTLEEVLVSCGWKSHKHNSVLEMVPPAMIGNRQVCIPELA